MGAPYKDAHPEVAWRQVINLRHRLVHDSEHIDYDVLWRALHDDDVPILRTQPEALLAAEGR